MRRVAFNLGLASSEEKLSRFANDPSTLEYLGDTPHKVLRVANPEEGFSFAAINNRAVEQVNADYVLFLNNDTEVITPEWLTRMVGYLRMPGVGHTRI